MGWGPAAVALSALLQGARFPVLLPLPQGEGWGEGQLPLQSLRPLTGLKAAPAHATHALLRSLSLHPQRCQSMPSARLFAGIAAGFKLATGRWAPFVNGAGRLFADLAGQGGAAGRAVVGATHPAQVVGDRGGQACGHAAATVLQLLHGKVNAKTGAAGAAGQAGVVHGEWAVLAVR